LRKFQAARFNPDCAVGGYCTIWVKASKKRRFDDVYLVDGELRHWEGPTQEVLSPVWVWESSQLVQKVIGKYPLLTEKESLNAAVNFG
jgi:hypothetical protein